MPPRVIIVNHASSSSLKNPCPSGTGIGYMNVMLDNNVSTNFVVCDKSFSNDNGGLSENDKLALGLGLGLGVPGLLIIVLIIRWYCINSFNKQYDITSNLKNIQIKPSTYEEQLKIKQRSYEEQLVDVITLLQKKLTKEAFTDLQNAKLTNILKQELTRLRMTEGRDLDDVVMYAKHLESIKIENFVKNLNPTDIYAKENHIV